MLVFGCQLRILKDYPAGIFLGQELFEALSNKLFAADFLTPYVVFSFVIDQEHINF